MADLRRAGAAGHRSLSERERSAHTVRRFRRELLLISLAVFAAAIASVQFRWFEVLDRLAFDSVLRSVPLPMSDDIVLVGIDARSLSALGRWPWSRARQADLIEVVVAQEPATIFVDIVYPDRSDAEDDARLVTAFNQPVSMALPVVIDAVSPGRALLEQLPFPELIDVVDRLGHVHVAPDGDGIVRGNYLYEGIGEPHWPHIGLVLGSEANLSVPSECERTNEGSMANERCGYRRIRFAGPPGTFPHLSAIDVIEHRIDREFLAGKVVLIGRTDLGAPDAIPVPVSADMRPMAGVEYNANVLNAVLHEGLVETGSVQTTLFVVLLMVGVGLFVIPRQRPRQMLVSTALLALVPVPMSAVLLIFAGVWIDLSAASVGIALIYPLWSWRRNEMGWQFVGDELDRLAAEAFRWSRSRARFNEGELPARLDWLTTGSSSSLSAELIAGIHEDQLFSVLPTGTLDPFVARLLRIQTLSDEVRVGREVSMAGIDQMPVGLCIFVASGNVVLSNESFRSFTGVTGSHTYFVNDALVCLLDVVWQDELRKVLLESAVRWLETHNAQGQRLLVRIAPLQVAGYAQPVCLLTISDVTDIRIAQERREETLAFVSHDLRSPISSILSIVRNPNLQNDPTAMSRIEAYAQRSLKVSEEFVQLSRLENAITVHRDEIDLVAVVENAVDQLYEFSRDKSINVTLTHPEEPGLWWIQGNGELLERVFVNLLENAIKYSPAGAIVQATMRITDTQFEICVDDKGFGIPASEVEFVFDPYFRSEAPELQAEKGVGLGLRFVRTAVELHGGQVTIESRYGAGSKFVVALPLSCAIVHDVPDVASRDQQNPL